MLEVKDLCKIYRPKRGVPVKALDSVSLVFPEKGMVFLLGKSGSGKSTLLNLLGGLDSYDGGEMIIKGVSSKNFAQKDFDSYRNTYVGFIFQEYNVLEEFSVGANIGLALELQGKKATDEEISRILEQVDLAGYGSRRPNELSGGQLQRVAIARALVKNPEIIMADEPTGALDSATGRAVLDTLKKLSQNKLVIVVSHDREFAEKYADRIIELGDGKVIRDVECASSGDEAEAALSFDGGIVSVPGGYRLTEEDRFAINRYIEARQSGIAISVDIQNRRFVPTDVSAQKRDFKGTFELIKSKLPMKSAFKIGAGGLKYKKFRLFMTVLLSTVAFSLFALADTFGSYRHVRTCVDSLIDSEISYVSINKAVRMEYGTGRPYWEKYAFKLDPEDLERFEEETGVYAGGVYVPGESMSLYGQYDPSVALSETDFDVISRSFTGFGEIDSAGLEEMGYRLVAGTLPDGDEKQIALTAYMCELFVRAGYSDGQMTYDENGIARQSFEAVPSCEAMIGKTVLIAEEEYTVTGVVDTHFDLERYLPLTKASSTGETSAAEDLVDYIVFNEFSYDRNYSHACVAFVGPGFIDSYRSTLANVHEMNTGYIWFLAEELANSPTTNDFSFNVNPDYVAEFTDELSGDIVWLDGERTALGEKELIVADNAFSVWGELNGSDVSLLAGDTGKLLSLMGPLRALGYSDEVGDDIDQDGWQIVGYVDTESSPALSGSVILPDGLADTLYEHDGVYAFAVGPMPRERGEITRLVESCYDESDDVRYLLQNPVVYELDIVKEVLDVLSKVFLYIGMGFALFAALLLANFIATSISYKKQEIGILRAIGSRSADVFRIFFSESFIIAMINFVLSVGFSAVITAVVNIALRNSTGILITILHFGVRQVLLLFAVGLLVAAGASFLPVWRIASKKPIDAIRNK